MKKIVSILGKSVESFQQETGLALAPWIRVALLNLAAQIIFRRELAPGAFGVVNTALAVVGLMIIPIVALQQAFAFYLAQTHAPERKEQIDLLRAAAPVIMQAFTWICVTISFFILPLFLPFLGLYGFSLSLFMIVFVALAIGGVANLAICQNTNQLRLWGWLLVISALFRAIFGAGLTAWEPRVESGLGACILASLILLWPALRQPETESARPRVWPALRDKDFLIYLMATFSSVLALFLFSSADRLVALSWFGASNNNNLGFVNWATLDNYQTAGLLGRALLWGTQPLLLIFFIQRSLAKKSTSASLRFFWIYLSALLLGVILLTLLAQPLSSLFCGADFRETAKYIPIFALAMIPLGLLQALGTFALASRRHPECFVLGACSIGYALLLYNVGRQPHLMLAYMFGGALFSVMLVLFVGVIRWSRTQP